MIEKEIVLYSTGCPKCNVLKSKLNKAGIKYTIVSDTNKILETGFNVVPILKVGDDFLLFKQANDYLNELYNEVK